MCIFCEEEVVELIFVVFIGCGVDCCVDVYIVIEVFEYSVVMVVL